jgi:hypothetical protein
MAQNRRRSFSVIVIPDDGSRTREFKVNAFMLRMALVLALAALGLSLLGGLSVLRLRGWGETVKRLQAENTLLRAEADKVQKLSQALERLKARDQQIRIMLSGSVPLNEASYDLSSMLSEPAGGDSAPTTTATPGRSPRQGR